MDMMPLLNQVVAEVSIGNGAPTDKIKKKEMAMAYVSYGYYYVYYYEYTLKRVMNLIIDNLVETRIMVQEAMRSFNEGKDAFANGVKKSNRKLFL